MIGIKSVVALLEENTHKEVKKLERKAIKQQQTVIKS
jgi:hypothetical protein